MELFGTGHRINETAQIFVLHVGDQLALEVVLNADQMQSFGRSHENSDSRVKREMPPRVRLIGQVGREHALDSWSTKISAQQRPDSTAPV